MSYIKKPVNPAQFGITVTSVAGDDVLIGRRTSDGQAINFTKASLGISNLSKKDTAYFEANLTQPYEVMLDAQPSSLIAQSLGVTGISYEVSTDLSTWTSQADIAAVKAYADGLTAGTKYALRIFVTTVTGDFGFVEITQK